MIALTNRLSALAAEDEVFVAGARVIAQEGGSVALAAVLREIDSTVLERTLVFGFGDATVSAIVAGRRLKGFHAVSGNAVPTDDVIGQPLSREEPQTLNAAGALMTQLCAAATRVTVRAQPIEPFGKGGDVGISATGLGDIWQVNLDAKPLPPVARFISANAGTLTAYLYVTDGVVVETSGDGAALQLIWDEQVLAFRKRQNALFKKPAAPQLICLEGAIGPGSAIAIVMAGDDACLCTLSPDDMTVLTRAWQSIIG
jgi:hypothetical protein